MFKKGKKMFLKFKKMVQYGPKALKKKFTPKTSKSLKKTFKSIQEPPKTSKPLKKPLKASKGLQIP